MPSVCRTLEVRDKSEEFSVLRSFYSTLWHAMNPTSAGDMRNTARILCYGEPYPEEWWVGRCGFHVHRRQREMSSRRTHSSAHSSTDDLPCAKVAEYQ